MSTIESPVLVFNPHVALAQTPEPQRPKVDVPDPVGNLLEADVFPHADGGDVHPPAIPPQGAGALHLDKVTTLESALPIVANQEVIGSIGISGAPGGHRDAACAQVGIDKIAPGLGN